MYGTSVSNPLILTCLRMKKLRPVRGVILCLMVTKGQSWALDLGFGLLAHFSFFHAAGGPARDARVDVPYLPEV